jgi:hypothetical protein
MNMNKQVEGKSLKDNEVKEMLHKQCDEKSATYVEYGDNFCPNYNESMNKFLDDLKRFSLAMLVMYDISKSDFTRDFKQLKKNVYTLELRNKRKVNKIVYVPNSDTYLIYVEHFGLATYLEDRLKRYLLMRGKDLKSTYIDSVCDDIYVVELEVGNAQNIANNEFFDIKTMTI